MQITYSIQSLLVYLTLFLASLAFVCVLLRSKRAARIIFVLAFVSSLLAFTYRYVCAAHLPMQSMFEIFLALAVLIWPISIFSRKLLGQKGILGDIIIYILVLFPAAFVFETNVDKLPEILKSPFFGPHVLCYLVGYIFMAKAAFTGATGLVLGQSKQENLSYALMLAGYPFLCTGMVLGSVWAKSAWGSYWGWDPKEMASLAVLLIYGAYFLIEDLYPSRRRILSGLFSLVGFGAILVTMLFINLSRNVDSLHNYN